MTLIPNLTIRRQPLETYLIVHEGDNEGNTWDRQLTAAEVEKLWAAAKSHDALLAAAKNAASDIHHLLANIEPCGEDLSFKYRRLDILREAIVRAEETEPRPIDRELA